MVVSLLPDSFGADKSVCSTAGFIEAAGIAHRDARRFR
jgi:hypothetical protein